MKIQVQFILFCRCLTTCNYQFSMSHPRVNQGRHGFKGGKFGNCVEARRAGKLGSQFGAQGGRKSQGVRKKELNYVQCLRLYEVYTAYDLFEEDSSVFSKYPVAAQVSIKEMCWGLYHENPKARMRECFIYLAESDAVQREKVKEMLKENQRGVDGNVSSAMVVARGKKKKAFQLIDWAENVVYEKET